MFRFCAESSLATATDATWSGFRTLCSLTEERGDLFCTKIRQYPKEGCAKGRLVFDVVTQIFPTRIEHVGQEIAKMVLLPFTLLER
jgi:hypothetical protein